MFWVMTRARSRGIESQGYRLELGLRVSQDGNTVGLTSILYFQFILISAPDCAKRAEGRFMLSLFHIYF